MRVHLIAIGGSIMHHLAITLKQNGHEVSGSDDDIYDPAKTNLAVAGLLPERKGWNPEVIKKDLDLVILGMHARKDNPELKKAIELGILVQSFPEFIYSQSQDKRRIVIAGSHGKTTTTSMIIHLLKASRLQYDYLVGAELEGFRNMVKLSDAPLMVLEGDEYLSSTLDSSPKFLHYRPDILVLTGIAWDHMNVFPTFEKYKAAFSSLLKTLPPESKVVWFEEDQILRELVEKYVPDSRSFPYSALPHINKEEDIIISDKGGKGHTLKIFGKHNLENLAAAIKVASLLAVPEATIYEAASTFEGASLRLEMVLAKNNNIVFRDFAHAPSKVRATVRAVREKYPEKKFIACLELHTFSSLNPEFLPEYSDTLDAADISIVFFSKETVKHKKLPPLQAAHLKNFFNNPRLYSITDPIELKQKLLSLAENNSVLLLMSSGRFQGMEIKMLAGEFCSPKE